MTHERMLPIVAVVVAVFLLMVVGCATPGTGTGYTLPSGETSLTLAADSYAAATGVARQTAEANRATAQAQAERERMTADVREQWFFEQTQTAVAVQATETARTNATATAEAVAWTTATAQANATTTAEAIGRTTATAAAQATATSVASDAATATASVVETRTAMQLAEEGAASAARLKRLKWEELTAPLIYVAEIIFWGLLVVVGLWTLIWAIPRLYHLLALKIASRGGENGDKVVYFVPMLGGIKEAWMGLPRLLSYDPDRDAGPGQVIEAGVEAGPLPGGDPQVTMRDQAIDLVHRPVVAGGRRPSRQRVR